MRAGSLLTEILGARWADLSVHMGLVGDRGRVHMHRGPLIC